MHNELIVALAFGVALGAGVVAVAAYFFGPEAPPDYPPVRFYGPKGSGEPPRGMVRACLRALAAAFRALAPHVGKMSG